ncbi:hypothetical protein [Nocardioides convexus]|uniref:DinB/UmuC family translesion DNA polymerase n=1 Tax=Nocardioides convexus TaxID=2712224 RepID=UPI0024182147|nr:hypothetical protein [Nocardioides convexus]
MRVIPPGRFVAEVHPLDVGVLYGVGEATRQRLHRLGLVTVGDVAALPVEQPAPDAGRTPGRAPAHPGVGHRPQRACARAGPVCSGSARVSRRAAWAPSTRWPWTSPTARGCTVSLLRLTSRVAARVRAAGRVGRTVAITVRFSDFTTVARSRTLPEPTDVTQEVYDTAVALLDTLLDAMTVRRPSVRLVGVRVEGLRRVRDGDSRQMALGERDPGWPDADRAVDRAASRFGSAAVRRASLLSAADSAPRPPGWPVQVIR